MVDHHIWLANLQKIPPPCPRSRSKCECARPPWRSSSLAWSWSPPWASGFARLTTAWPWSARSEFGPYCSSLLCAAHLGHDNLHAQRKKDKSLKVMKWSTFLSMSADLVEKVCAALARPKTRARAALFLSLDDLIFGFKFCWSRCAAPRRPLQRSADFFHCTFQDDASKRVEHSKGKLSKLIILRFDEFFSASSISRILLKWSVFFWKGLFC